MKDRSGGMNVSDKKRLFLLGLDETLLWQLTRSLASVADAIEYSSAGTVSEAGELLRQREFNLVVVDGADMGMRVLQSLPRNNSHHVPRLLVLTEESSQDLPQEMLLPDDTLFLERPFNAKEFPFFVLKALEEIASHSVPPGAPPDERPVTALYGLGVEAEDDFYRYFNEGFDCISRQDLIGARENWLKARTLRPGDRKVEANLARLEKMISADEK